MRKTVVAGNWKMNKSPAEGAELAHKIGKKLGNVTQIDIVIFPPFPALAAVYEEIKQGHIRLGAQNVFWEKEGAYTGEVSAPMLRESGCRYVIIGHSERRIVLGETDEVVNRKVKAALRWNLTPIVCVGEKLEEREGGRVEEVLRTQITGSLSGLNDDDLAKMVLAYEPVWAIGTGKTATSSQANETQGFIRKLVADAFSEDIASKTRILYGGSVKPDNIAVLIAEQEIDGALIGGASMDDSSFVKIAKICLSASGRQSKGEK